MPTEIEAKLKVESHNEIRSRLAAAGATPAGAVLETNIIFDNAARSFLAEDRGLRVRSFDVIEGPDRPPELTYKGPRQAGSLKTREEIELTVSDADAARSLLTELGFVQALTFEKRRETWQLGDCHVELDEVPHLGTYVEVEGPDAEAVEQVLRRIGLADGPIIKESYIGPLMDYCRRHDLPTDQIRFELCRSVQCRSGRRCGLRLITDHDVSRCRFGPRSDA